jgi:hypothetical protein
MNIWPGKANERGCWEYLGSDGRIILKRYLKEIRRETLIEFFWLMLGASGG